MSTVQEYLTPLMGGKKITIIDQGQLLIEVYPPDPSDADKGFDPDATPSQTLETYRAFAAWLRAYRAMYPNEYRALIIGNPE